MILQAGSSLGARSLLTLLALSLAALLPAAGCGIVEPPAEPPDAQEPATPAAVAPPVSALPTVAPGPTAPTTAPIPSVGGTGPAAAAPRLGSPRDLAELPPSVGRSYRISPDGRWVSYQAPPVAADGGQPGALVARDLQSGQLLSLVEGLWLRRHTWLPDSSGVVVVVAAESGQTGEILARRLASGPATSLAKAPKDSFGFEEVAISPDGHRIACTVHYDASPAPVPKIGVLVMGLDGSDQRQIVEPNFFVGHLYWSPDGRQVVYFKGRGGTPPEDGEAYVADAEGPAGSPRLLLPRVRLAAWSPDGRRALWVGEPMDPGGNADLFVTGWPHPASPRRLAEGAGAFGADWVESGEWVVYSQRGALYLAPADGSGAPSRLTPEGEWAGAPVWLPGKGIAYYWQPPGVAAGKLRLLPSP